MTRNPSELGVDPELVEQMDDLRSRCKTVWVHPREIMGLFCGRDMELNEDGKVVAVYSQELEDSELQEAYLDRVIYEPQRQGFAFLLCHPNWPQVPMGQQPPEVIATIHRRRFVVTELEQDG